MAAIDDAGVNGKKNDGVWRFMMLPNANHSSMGSMVARLAPTLVRVGAMLATIAAALVMGLNKQTRTTAVAIVGTTPLYQTLIAKFNQTPAFVYFVIANAIASVYNLLVLSLGLLFRKCKRYEVTIHLADMVMMALVATGVAAATSIAELGKNGDLHARWSPICDKFHDYCHRGGLALVLAFVGAGLLIILNAHSIVSLRKSANSRL